MVRRLSRLSLWLVSVSLCAAPLAAEAPLPRLVQPGDNYHLVFVSSFLAGIDSSTTIPTNFPNFGGLAGGDYNVTLAAFDAGLPGVPPTWDGETPIWKAILSSSAATARARINIAGPVYNMAGQLVANDSTDLWDGSIDAPIQYTELGSIVSGETAVWTGTGALGTWSTNSAHDWTSQLGLAHAGSALAQNNFWTSDVLRAASLSSRLYGMSPAITMTAMSPTSSTTLGPRPASDLLPTGGIALAGTFEFQPQQVTFDSGCNCWHDAGLTSAGMLFETTDGSLFTGVSNFSDELLGPVTVWAGGQNLGEFSAGDELDFLTLLGFGVDSFAITGIDLPPSATGVPFYLLFDGPGAEFTVRALELSQQQEPPSGVPEPTGGVVFAVVLLAGMLLAWRRVREPRSRLR